VLILAHQENLQILETTNVIHVIRQLLIVRHVQPVLLLVQHAQVASYFQVPLARAHALVVPGHIMVNAFLLVPPDHFNLQANSHAQDALHHVRNVLERPLLAQPVLPVTISIVPPVHV